jgi:hypothetical protein
MTQHVWLGEKKNSLQFNHESCDTFGQDQSI